MSRQKFRADSKVKMPNNGIAWYANWIGGSTLAKINNCLLDNLAGEMRRTVYTLGEPDTFFSIPAVTTIQGKQVNGYVTETENGLVFRHTYY